MVKHLRIDNRLIHGQVAVNWKSHVNADAIIVCNDQVAEDKILKLTLPMAAAGSKVHILRIDELIAYDQEHPSETKFVICKLATDALELLRKGLEVEELNIGNQAPVQGTDYKMVTGQIAVTQEEAASYRELARLNGGKLTSQLIPSYQKEDFLALLEKAGL